MNNRRHPDRLEVGCSFYREAVDGPLDESLEFADIVGNGSALGVRLDFAISARLSHFYPTRDEVDYYRQRAGALRQDGDPVAAANLDAFADRLEEAIEERQPKVSRW